MLLGRLAPAALIVATILTYLPVFSNGFVYDDHFQLERNPYVKDFRHLKVLLTKEVWYFSLETRSNNYRPLHMIAYLLVYRMFGLQPWIYHAASLLFFLVSVLLIWKIFGTYVAALPAFLGALLFATHPVHVESVSWIGGYPDLLCGMFLFLSFLFYRHGKYVLSLLGFLLALFSKETALMFPVIIAADFLIFRKSETARSVKWLSGAMLLMMIYAALRVYALGYFARVSLQSLSPLSMLQAGVVFSGLYIEKMLFPFPLNAHYHFSLPLSFSVSSPAMLLLLSVLILVYVFRRNKLFLFGSIWFFLFLIPALFLREVSPVLFAERYLYLPSAGFILAILALPWRSYIPFLLILVCIAFGAISFARTKIWRTDLTLWTDTVEKSPLSWTVHYNLATAFLKEGNYADAATHYRTSVSLDPQMGDSYYNLAICEYNLGRKDNAAENLQKFLRYARSNHPMRKDAEAKLRQLSP